MATRAFHSKISLVSHGHGPNRRSKTNKLCLLGMVRYQLHRICPDRPKIVYIDTLEYNNTLQGDFVHSAKLAVRVSNAEGYQGLLISNNLNPYTKLLKVVGFMYYCSGYYSGLKV
jgi:hypothetical protein